MPIPPPPPGSGYRVRKRESEPARLGRLIGGSVWMPVWPPPGVPTLPPPPQYRIGRVEQVYAHQSLRHGWVWLPLLPAWSPAVPLAPRPTPWHAVRRPEGREAAPQTRAGWTWLPRTPNSPEDIGFTQQYITGVNPPVQYGSTLFLSWTSDAPPGLVYQVYVNEQLVWYGTSPYASIPLPTSISRIDIGTVGAANATVSFASILPPAPNRIAELSWLGGTYEDPDIAGFHVYGEHTPATGIDYKHPLATISAYTAGVVTDGFGYGGFGLGGFGEASGAYSWKSEPLSGGTWHFAVVPFDTAGNEGTGRTVAVTINAPPLPPAPFADRLRLHYLYDQPSKTARLMWNASPG
jgi:hypothetical protein